MLFHHNNDSEYLKDLLIERNYGKLIIIHLQEKYINKRIQMATNYKESLIKELIKDFSIETTPGVYSKYGKFIEFNSKNMFNPLSSIKVSQKTCLTHFHQ